MSILFLIITSLISVLAGFLYSRWTHRHIRQEVDDLSSERQDLLSGLSHAGHQLDRASERLAILEPDLESARQDNARIRQEWQESAEKVRDRETQIGILRTHIENLTTQQNEHDRQLTEARVAVESAETRTKEQAEATARALARKTEVGIIAAQQRSAIEQLTNQADTLRQAIDRAKSESRDVRAEMKQVRAQAQSDVDEASRLAHDAIQEAQAGAQAEIERGRLLAESLVEQARADASLARVHANAIAEQAQRIAVAILEDYGPPSKSPELGQPTTHVQVASNIFTQSVQNFYGTLATDMNTAWRIALNDRYTTTNPDIAPLLQRFLAQHTTADSTRAYAKLNSIARGITDSTA